MAAPMSKCLGLLNNIVFCAENFAIRHAYSNKIRKYSFTFILSSGPWMNFSRPMITARMNSINKHTLNLGTPTEYIVNKTSACLRFYHSAICVTPQLSPAPISSFTNKATVALHSTASSDCELKDYNINNNECCKNCKCWKCGTTLNIIKDQFFCGCGVVQTPKLNNNFFRVMGVEESYDVDIANLSTAFKNLQRRLHPDKFVQKCQMEKSLSEQQSSRVNEAYTCLLNPLSRAIYMLKLNDSDIEEGEIQFDANFFDEIMELNEAIADAKTAVEIQDIASTTRNTISNLISEISGFFSMQDIESAKDRIVKLKYFVTVENKIKEMERNDGII